MATLTYAEAGKRALAEEMRRDPLVWAVGEDLGRGGVFGQYKGMVEEFGPLRISDAPISEAAILGAAVGAAMTGTRPVVLRPGGVYLLLSLDTPSSRLPWLHDEPGLDWSVAVTPFAKRGELETTQNHYGGARSVGDAQTAVDVLVPAREEVLVGSQEGWEAKMQAFDADRDSAYTFLYVCTKRS